MKNQKIIGSLLVFSLLGVVHQGETADLKAKFVPGEVIVKFKTELNQKPTASHQMAVDVADTGKSSINKILKRTRAKSAKQVARFRPGRRHGNQKEEGLRKIYRLKFNKDENIQSVVSEYLKDPNVEYAEPNYIYRTNLVPNDPGYPQQWAPAKINAPIAWDVETGKPSTIIAIVDTGIDYTHPDLSPNIWRNTDEIPDNNIDDDGNGYVDDVRGWNFTDTDKGNDPMDIYGHGTHCAGIAGARGNNAIGIAGVCWNCQLMPVKGLSDDGSGTLTDLIGGILYAADNGAKVISNSWGGGGPSNAVEDAIDYATSKGALVIFAAGNESSESPAYPAYYAYALAVAATDSNDIKSSFSNFGSWVEVSAPGTNIYSTLPLAGSGIGKEYGTASGTSMACPAVAGLAGLLFSQHPFATIFQIRQAIQENTDDIYPKNQSYAPNKLGSGRINASRAVNLYSLNGFTRDQANEGIASVYVKLVGGNSNLATVSDSSGYFELSFIQPRNYILTPFTLGVDFSPISRTYNPLNADQTDQNFTGTPAVPPLISILSPTINQSLSNTVIVSGTASDDKEIAAVEVRINTDPWILATGLGQWSRSLDITPYLNDSYVISARVTDSAGLMTSASVPVLFNSVGSGVAYDPVLKAPVCRAAGYFCDSFSLLQGRGNSIDHPELNQPNTLLNSCQDGSKAEGEISVDRIKLVTNDLTNLAEGKDVRLEVLVRAENLKFKENFVDIYHASDANVPVWELVASFPTSGMRVGGRKTFYADATLPAGSMQALRARIRYHQVESPCKGLTVDSELDDIDDLAFAVAPPTPPLITIISPAEGDEVGNFISIKGTAGNISHDSKVEVKIDDGAFQLAVGTTAWSLTYNATLLAEGIHTLTARVTNPHALSASTSLNVTLLKTGANYSNFYQAPICDSVGSSCDSIGLLKGRGNTTGNSEINQPNTLFNSCQDGINNNPDVKKNAGSMNRIKVETLDGSTFAPGKQVKIVGTVYANILDDVPYNLVDFYYANNANDPAWNFIGSADIFSNGNKSIEKVYTLPEGTLQAVRVSYIGRDGSGFPCLRSIDGGQYNDYDDLAFAVAPLPVLKMAITSPKNGEVVPGAIRIRGIASEFNNVTKVEVKIDDGSFQLAVGTSAWVLDYNLNLFPEGDHTITARATNKFGLTGSTSVVVNLHKTVAATYSNFYKTPICNSVENSCDSTNLLEGRGTVTNNAEINQPNTIFNSCQDGNYDHWLTNYRAGSMNRIRVSTLDGSNFAVEKQVRIEASIWANGIDYITPYVEAIFYYAADVNDPDWKWLGVVNIYKNGYSVVDQVYTLSEGPLQVVRVNYIGRGGGGSAFGAPGAICADLYEENDSDDLVFAVPPPALPTISITRPMNGDVVVGAIRIKGTASKYNDVTKVEVKINNGDFQLAMGTSSWSVDQYLSSLPDGNHTITARATTKFGLTSSTSVVVNLHKTIAATYSSFYKAPLCESIGNSCDSTILLEGRGRTSDNAEVNQPNTLFNLDQDGDNDDSNVSNRAGSIDRIQVQTLDGSNFSTGKQVKIEATVNTSGIGMFTPFVVVNFCYASNANTPIWNLLASAEIYENGKSVINEVTTLPEGSLQAVRVNYMGRGSGSKVCSDDTLNEETAYIDYDDMAFAVSPPLPPVISINAPRLWEQVPGVIHILGTAANVNSDTKVEVTIDDRPYQLVVGTESWKKIYYLTSFPDGPHTITARATNQFGLTGSTSIVIYLQKTTEALYDTDYKAPICRSIGNSCDSLFLLEGRSAITTNPEWHQPNTIFNSCPDGANDNSDPTKRAGYINRIKVRTVNGSTLGLGKQVKIEATIVASGIGVFAPYAEADFYYAGKANNPVWTRIGSERITQNGTSVISKTYTLPNGDFQAVRVNYIGRSGSGQPCPLPGSDAVYNDSDDLAFAVTPLPLPPVISITSPKPWEQVPNVIRILGTASNVTSASKVEVTIDDRPYELVVGTESWRKIYYMNVFSDGWHTITARVTNETGLVASTSVVVSLQRTTEALYDTSYKVPVCRTVGNSCDSIFLLEGRSAITVNPEWHQPNTLFNSCPDGTNDNSDVSKRAGYIDRIKLRTVDGSILAMGKQVKIEATIVASGIGVIAPYAEADFYASNSASNPIWTYLGSERINQNGSSVITKTYTLPKGDFQAVRVNYIGRSGSGQPCPLPGNDAVYNDSDDLAFAITPTYPAISITAPKQWEQVPGVISILGTASNVTSASKVEVAIDDRPYQLVAGTESWKKIYYMSSFADGWHTIKALVTNESGLAAAAGVTVNLHKTLPAVYDNTYKVPMCNSVWKSCDSNFLLEGRGLATGNSEEHKPNTLFNSCPDGTGDDIDPSKRAGSIQRIKVETVDGSLLAPGKKVEIEATVMSSGIGVLTSFTQADFYYANNANNPSWILLGSTSLFVNGEAVVKKFYTLPQGTLQAVRVNYIGKQGGAGNSCSSSTGLGMHNDFDDLAFLVGDSPLSLDSPYLPTKGGLGNGVITLNGAVNSRSGFGDVFCYPNPGRNPTFHIEYTGQPESVALDMYDSAGKAVQHVLLTAEHLKNVDGKSAYEYAWPADGMSSGVYYYVVSVKDKGNKSSVKKSFVLLN